MNVTLAMIADAANVSREGKLNVLGSFRNINAASFPARHPEMVTILRLEASPAEVGLRKQLQIILIDQDGKSQGDGFQTEITVPTPKQSGRRIRMQLIVRLLDTTFDHEGDYSVAILINGQTEAEIPLSVTLVTVQEQGEAKNDG